MLACCKKLMGSVAISAETRSGEQSGTDYGSCKQLVDPDKCMASRSSESGYSSSKVPIVASQCSSQNPVLHSNTAHIYCGGQDNWARERTDSEPNPVASSWISILLW